MTDSEINTELKSRLRRSWHEFLDVVSPIRPQLHQYCFRLTGNVWDAEDLCQDALVKAFGYLGRIDDPVRNPRAYLVKTATTVWLDSMRRQSTADTVLRNAETLAPTSTPAATAAVQDAGRHILSHLTRRQTAAILMKDVFEMSLSECAEVLETNEGAIKSLLSRARNNLATKQLTPVREALVSHELVEKFVKLYNAADIEGLLQLVLDNATVGNVGTDIEWGRDGHRGPFNWFKGSIGGHAEDWPADLRFESQCAEKAEFEGEPLVLIFRTRRGDEALESIVRLTEEGGHISKLRAYSFTPETIAFVAQHLGLNVRNSGYRYPTPSPGKRFSR